MKPTLELTFDTEANGLLHEMTRFWCIDFYDWKKGRHYEFSEVSKNSISDVPRFITWICDKYNVTIICHNLFGYDLFAMRNHLGIQFGFDSLNGLPINLVDTLDMSRRLQPDRPMPKGCPKSVFNPVTGKNKKIGPHGLEAFGYRVAKAKPVIHDWRNGKVEDYLHRCKEDNEILALTYQYLLKEKEEMQL